MCDHSVVNSVDPCEYQIIAQNQRSWCVIEDRANQALKRVMQKIKSRKAQSRTEWRLEQVCVPFLLISMLCAWVECCPEANERDVSMSLITQHPYQPGKPCQDAGGNTGILYCQWCQRSEEVLWLPLWTTSHWLCGRSVWLFWILNIFTGSLLERFSTAKLVMTTSQTPSESRSVAANDVSSCAYILPQWHPFFPSAHSPT